MSRPLYRHLIARCVTDRRAVAIATVGAVLGALTIYAPSRGARADDSGIARGKYLAAFGGCLDCHTQGYFFGKPDMARYLGGSDVGFEIPGLGIFVGPNITPDNDTGIGRWSSKEIVTAIRTGVRPDGRILAPIMPWQSLAALTDADAQAIAAFLKSLPPVSNKVAGPFHPGEKSTVFVMKIVPPETAPPAK